MTYEFKLPDIGEGVVEGEIVRWLVKEGDVVVQDQPLVEVMTDKATVEIPAPRPGLVLERLYAEGQVCPVGRVLIRIEESGTAPATSSPPARAEAPAPEAPPPPRPAPVAPAAGGRRPEDVLATPATRKLARELGVDLAVVSGTGPGGRITSEDVRGSGTRPQAASLAARSGAGDVRVPFRGVRRKIAEHMVRAKREAAHFTYVEEVDVTNLVALRAKANQRLAPAKLSYLPFIIKAVVDGLRRFPQLNAWLDDAAGEIVQRREYHIGLATATAEGLIVPVVRHADRRSVVELGQEIDRLAQATRAGKATREELSGSTFTITSLGTLGGLHATPIINVPECAILGVHKIAKRPVVFGDKVEIREMMNLSISVDHRLTDGFDAARFVAAVKDSLETPGLLFLESV